MTERRRNTRQPLRREVRYRLRLPRAAWQSGTTLNISSKAIAFQTPSPLAVGARLDISVNWPAEAGSILRLTAQGLVIRSDSRSTVCTMEEAAFRAEELDEEAVGIAMTASVGWARSGW